MAAMSDYLENQVMTHIFRTGTFTKPTVLALALCTATCTDAMTGTNIPEVTGNGYARLAVNPLDATWGSTTSGTVTNASSMTFIAASGDWSGTITQVAICNGTVTAGGSGCGDLMFYGNLSSPKTVTNGDIFQFAAGQLSISID